MCWSFGVFWLEWYPCCRLKPATRIPHFTLIPNNFQILFHYNFRLKEYAEWDLFYPRYWTNITLIQTWEQKALILFNEMWKKRHYIKLYKCKIFTKIKFFISQSRSDTPDVLQGVVAYIYLAGLLFVFSWFGDELSTEVNTFDNLNFSFMLLFLILPSKSYIFPLIPVWSAKIIPMLLFTLFDVHFSSFPYNQVA